MDLRERVEQSIEEHYDAAAEAIRAPHREFLDAVEKRRAPQIEAAEAERAAIAADEEAKAAESEAWSADMRGDNKAKSRARERYTAALQRADELREKARTARERAEEFDEVAAAEDLAAHARAAAGRMPERAVTGMEAEGRARRAVTEAAEAACGELESRKSPTDPWVGSQVLARARAEEQEATSEVERLSAELAEVKAKNADAYRRGMDSKGGLIPDGLKDETRELAGTVAGTYNQGQRLQIELARAQGRVQRARGLQEQSNSEKVAG